MMEAKGNEILAALWKLNVADIEKTLERVVDVVLQVRGQQCAAGLRGWLGRGRVVLLVGWVGEGGRQGWLGSARGGKRWMSSHARLWVVVCVAYASTVVPKQTSS
jgi:hypothetical protein